MASKLSFRFPASLCLLILLTTVAAGAQTSGAPKIALIDVQRIIYESQAGQSALQELETFGQEQESRLEAQRAEAEDLRQRISEGQLMLTEGALEELTTELQTKMVDLKRATDDATREFSRRQQEVLQGIERKVMPIIQQLGTEGSYSMIFRKYESGLVFASDDMDVTDEVVRRLDAGAP